MPVVRERSWRLLAVSQLFVHLTLGFCRCACSCRRAAVIAAAVAEAAIREVARANAPRGGALASAPAGAPGAAAAAAAAGVTGAIGAPPGAPGAPPAPAAPSVPEYIRRLQDEYEGVSSQAAALMEFYNPRYTTSSAWGVLLTQVRSRLLLSRCELTVITRMLSRRQHARDSRHSHSASVVTRACNCIVPSRG